MNITNSKRSLELIYSPTKHRGLQMQYSDTSNNTKSTLCVGC